jgi:hypothetical protein
MTEAQSTTWRDAKGRAWNLRYTAGNLIRLADDLGVDLLSEETKESALAGLLSQPALLSHCLWSLCEKQAAARNIDRDDFYAALEADPLADGWRAMGVALVNFSPRFDREKVEAKLAAITEAIEACARALADHWTNPTTITELKVAALEVEAPLGASSSNKPPCWG